MIDAGRSTRGLRYASDPRRRSHIDGVVTISISAEALAAIAATLADDREAEHRPDGKGAYFITLPRDVLDKLNYLRGPGES
jgi:hypothetical protein